MISTKIFKLEETTIEGKNFEYTIVDVQVYINT